MAERPDRPRDSSGRAGKLALLTTVGLMFPVAITVGGAFGYYLDRKLGTLPWLSATFLIFGIAAAFINLIRVLKKFDESP